MRASRGLVPIMRDWFWHHYRDMRYWRCQYFANKRDGTMKDLDYWSDRAVYHINESRKWLTCRLP